MQQLLLAAVVYTVTAAALQVRPSRVKSQESREYELGSSIVSAFFAALQVRPSRV